MFDAYKPRVAGGAEEGPKMSNLKYVPYFRAKQNEVIAVRELAVRLAAHGKVLPVFEPVSLSSGKTLQASAKHFVDAGLAIGVVVNPRVGKLVNQPARTSAILSALTAANVHVVPVMIAHASLKDAVVKRFSALNASARMFLHVDVPQAAGTDAAIRADAPALHAFKSGACGAAYEQTFSGSTRFVIHDGFKSQARNADYPNTSFFSDAHSTYVADHWDGFGDFSIVGDRFSPSGGAALTVAIHMTETSGTGVRCNHFLSTTNLTTANPAGKFTEAMNALSAYVRAHPGRIDFSDGHANLMAHHRSSHFPGLGVAKREMMRHHLELMLGLI